MYRKLIASVLACPLCMSVFIGCGKMKSDSMISMETVESSDYSISFCMGPPIENFTQEAVANMKAAGFDMIPLERLSWGTDDIKRALKILKDNNLNASVKEWRLEKICNTIPLPSQEQIDEVVQTIVDDYKDYDNIKEWIVYDEPNSSKFEAIGRIVDAFRRLDPDRKVFTNLLPDYAGNDMLGAGSYDEYLQMFCETVKPYSVCFDYYDFIGPDLTASRRGTFLINMESIKSAGDKYGLETRVIVLATQHMGYSRVTPAEIAWQANLSLLYGTKQLIYFSYWLHDDPAFDDAVPMTRPDGSLTEHFYDVLKEDQKTRVLGDALYPAKCDKVFKINTYIDYLYGPEDYTSYGRLGRVDGKDMLVSFYDNDWFMIMNGLSLDNDNNVRSVTTKDINGMLFWLNPKSRTWESFHSCDGITRNKDGQYTISLRAGDSLLMRVEAEDK